MKHSQPGEQDDRRNPEVNVGENRGPHAAGTLWMAFIRHAFVSPRSSPITKNWFVPCDVATPSYHTMRTLEESLRRVPSRPVWL
jgi:hypothetical protein